MTPRRNARPGTETKSGKIPVIVATIGLISAVTVAVVGLIGVWLSGYFTQLLPLQATQTAEARAVSANALAPTSTPTTSAAAPVTPTSTVNPTSTPTASPTPTATPTPTPSPTPTPNGILIDDFENGIDGAWYAARRNTDDWQAKEVATNVFKSPDAAAGNGALKCDFDFGVTNDPNPTATCFRVNLPIQDWRPYHALQFKAKSLVDLSTNLRVFIALATGEKSCWNELGDFQLLGREYQTFTFNLDRNLYKTCTHNGAYDQALVGREQVTRLHLIFKAEHQPSGAALIDDIWLLRP